MKRQVRSPVGRMPAFPISQLSDESLQKISTYIASLEQGDHIEPVELPNIAAMHHHMAIIAIKEENAREALHHIGHILDLVEGEHLHAVEEAQRQLRAGNLHDAEHLLEEALPGLADPELTTERAHLQLALQALEVDDSEDAEHHVGHFLETAQGDEAAKGRAALEALGKGLHHDAEDGLREILGQDHGHG